MKFPDSDSRRAAEREPLELRLAELASPDPPPDLLPRLLADIPAEVAPQCGGARPTHWSTPALLAALPAAVALGLAWSFLWTPTSNSARSGATLPENSDPVVINSTAFHKIDETDPCHILPPLPDWR